MRRFLSVIALPLFSATAAAQEPTRPAAADSVRELEPVVVTGTRAPVVLGGASGLVIHPDSLRIPPAASLEQALRELPFVLVRQNSRGETELSLRGSESRQVAVLLDGIPLTLGWDHRTDPSLVPLTGAQRLVLVRGLSSLLHGPNVLGGIVEVDLARGAPGAVPARELSLGMGIADYGARVVGPAGAVPLAAGDHTLALRGGVGYRARDGVALSHDALDPTAGGGQRTNSDLEQVDGFAAVRWQHAGGRYLGVTATGFHAERGVPPELHLRAPRLWRYPAVSRGLAILSAGTGPVTTPFGFGHLNLSAGAHLGSMEVESFETTAYQAVVGREQGEERTLSARLHGNHSLPGDGELRLALTGAEVRYDETLDRDPTSRYRQRLWSAGLEAQWPVLGRALVGGGLVHDAASTPETGGKLALGGLSHWGWRLGATTPVAGDPVSLHASVSHRARFPSLRELYSGSLHRFEPNPTLRPERLLGAELGATLSQGFGRGGVLNAQATVFHHRLTDAVVRTPTADGRFRRENRDQLRSTGVELLAGWTRAGVSVTADLLLQRVRLHDPAAKASDASERRPEHQPEARGRFGVGVPLSYGISLATDLRYVGRQFCIHPDLGGPMALAGQAEGDIALERTWAIRGGSGAGPGFVRSLRAMLALDNVTDATVYDQCGLPRPGRTLRLAIQLGL